MSDGISRRDLYKAALGSAIVTGGGIEAVHWALRQEHAATPVRGVGSVACAVDVDRVGTGDSTALIQEALQELPDKAGVLLLPALPDGRHYQVDGTIDLHARQCLFVPPGVQLIREKGAGTGPLINLQGSLSTVIGGGHLMSRDPTPVGLVSVGPGEVTRTAGTARVAAGRSLLSVASNPFTAADVGKSITVDGAGPAGDKMATTIRSVVNPGLVELEAKAGTSVAASRVSWGSQSTVAWSQVVGIHLTGDGSDSSCGIHLYSSPQGHGDLTFGNGIQSVLIESVGVGVRFTAQANANSVLGCQFQRISLAAISIEDSVENCVMGGFVHQAQSLQSVVRGRGARYSTVVGLTTEPGGKSLPYDLDEQSTQNTLHVMHNSDIAGIDRGDQNTLWIRDQLSAQRVVARDGLGLKVVQTDANDALFERAPTAGLTAFNAVDSTLWIRADAGWRSVQARRRDLVTRRTVVVPSIAAGETVDVDVPFEGARVDDSVTATPALGAVGQAITWNVLVAGDDAVVLRLANLSKATSASSSGSWSFGCTSPD